MDGIHDLGGQGFGPVDVDEPKEVFHEAWEGRVWGIVKAHLPEPEQAFREAFRVLRSGGRMAFTVWAAPKQGEGFGIVLGAITEHEVPDPSLPPAPPYFRFADAAETHSVFASAGFIASATSIGAAVLAALHAGRGLRSFQRRRGPSNRDASCPTA